MTAQARGVASFAALGGAVLGLALWNDAISSTGCGDSANAGHLHHRVARHPGCFWHGHCVGFAAAQRTRRVGTPFVTGLAELSVVAATGCCPAGAGWRIVFATQRLLGSCWHGHLLAHRAGHGLCGSAGHGDHVSVARRRLVAPDTLPGSDQLWHLPVAFSGTAGAADAARVARSAAVCGLAGGHGAAGFLVLAFDGEALGRHVVASATRQARAGVTAD